MIIVIRSTTIVSSGLEIERAGNIETGADHLSTPAQLIASGTSKLGILSKNCGCGFGGCAQREASFRC